MEIIKISALKIFASKMPRWSIAAPRIGYMLLGALGGLLAIVLLFLFVEWHRLWKCESNFRHRMGQYESIVKKIELDLPSSEQWTRFQAYEEPGLIERVFAKKDRDGVITVEFLSGGAFPVKHWGIAYSSDDNSRRVCLRLEAGVKRLRPFWFRWVD